MKKTEIFLKFREDDQWRRTWSLLNVENDKTVVKVKIKSLGIKDLNSDYYKWRRGYYFGAAFTIEPIEITFLDGIETIHNGRTSLMSEGERKIKINTLTIVYQNERNHFPLLDKVFYEGSEVKLKLKNPNFSELDNDFGHWLLREWGDNEKNNFRLEIHSNYEIGGFNFLQIDDEEIWNERRLKENLEKEEEEITEWKNKLLNNLYSICLNHQGQIVDAKNPKSYEVVIGEEIIDLSKIIGSEYWHIRKALVREIKNNLSDWKIEGEIVKNKSGRQHWRSGLVKKFGSSLISDDSKIILEWLGVEAQLIKLQGKENQKSNQKLISCFAQYQGIAPTDGYYLFISQDNKHTFEISQNHPIFIQNKPKMKGESKGNNCLFYKMYWLAREKKKKLFTPEDLIKVVEQKERKFENEKGNLTELEETRWYQKPTNYFWGIVIVVGVFTLLFLVKKILGIGKS